MGLKPSEIHGMTPRELTRMWDAHFKRQSDTMDIVALHIFTMRSTTGDKEVMFEDIREMLGWQKAEKNEEDEE